MPNGRVGAIWDRLSRPDLLPWLDWAGAAGLLAGLLSYAAVAGLVTTRNWAVPTAVVTLATALAVRRRWPIPAAAVAGIGILIVDLSGRNGPATEAFDILPLFVPFAVCYTLGTSVDWRLGLVCSLIMELGLQWPEPVPVFTIVTVGPWATGRLVLSRRELVEQIEERNQALEAERSMFAQESVRYERARIARELHDIVGHCVSVMVIQASAGQRLADSDPALVAKSLERIAEAAEAARTEIGLLVDLLDDQNGHAKGLDTIDELVRRAVNTGLGVRYRFAVDGMHHSGPVAEAAYRVVQEALTNALRYAPGAPIQISVTESCEALSVEVSNEPPGPGSSGLEHTGGGRGLLGMNDRVAQCGGTLTVGPARDGGWRVHATWPGELARRTPAFSPEA